MESAQSDEFIRLITKESRKELEKKYLDEVAFVQMILRMKEKSSNPNMYWSVIKTRIDRCRVMEETLKGVANG